MRTERLLMPYILTSMHSIIHFTFLLMAIFIRIDFLESNKPHSGQNWEDAMSLMAITHIFCIIFDGMIGFFRYIKTDKDNGELNPYKHAFLIKSLMLIKLFLYFIAILHT